MLQNFTVTPFTAFELLRVNQLGGEVKLLPSPAPRLGLTWVLIYSLTKYVLKDGFKGSCVMKIL